MRGMRVRIGAVAGVTSLALAVSAIGAGAASATREPEDVSSQVLSNVVVQNPSTMGVNVTREADYSTSTPEWLYTTNVEGLGNAAEQQCTTTFNGATLKEGACWTLVGFAVDGLDNTGNYALKTATDTLASWTFTRPSDAPPALGPAICVIKSIKTQNVTKKGTKFQVKTNGKCSNGDWTSWSDPGTYGWGATKSKKTFTFRNQYILKSNLPTKMTLTFTPDAFLKESSRSVRVS